MHYFPQDGVCSPEDIDTTFTEGLGLRYSLIGPFKDMQLNANGMIIAIVHGSVRREQDIQWVYELVTQ